MVRVCCTVYFELSTEELSNFLFFCDEQRTPSVKVSSESEQTTTTYYCTDCTDCTYCILHCLLPAVGHCMNTHKHDSRSIIRYTEQIVVHTIQRCTYYIQAIVVHNILYNYVEHPIDRKDSVCALPK